MMALLSACRHSAFRYKFFDMVFARRQYKVALKLFRLPGVAVLVGFVWGGRFMGHLGYGSGFVVEYAR